MKKFTPLFFVMVLMLSTLFTFAQKSNRQVVYSDDFESYTVGAYLAQSNTVNWTTWSNTPGTAEDAVISSDVASSPTKSVMVSGTNDMVLKLGDKTSGLYTVSFDYLVPVGFGGYYNFQHTEVPGTEWAFEVYFDNNGTGYMHAGGSNAATFTFTNGEWISIMNVIDLDADWAQVYFDGTLIYEWQFSLQAQGAAGMKQLGGVNLYAGATAGMTAKYYFDNVEYSVVTGDFLYYDDFESYTVGAYLAQSNTENWTTWSNTPGTAEDAVISNDVASSPTKSVKVSGTNDMVLKLGNKTSGLYTVSFDFYVPVGFGGYYNFQHFEAPGNEWAFEVYFDNNGTGYMHAGGSNAATFTFTNGEWMSITNIIDLDADWAQVFFDDVLIYEWQFSLQAQGAAGTKQLGGVNFYAGATAGMTPKYYFDNVAYAAVTENFIFADDFDAYTAPAYVAVTIPEFFTTWSNTPGTAEDATFSTEFAESAPNSAKVIGTTDLVMKLGNKTSGKYVLAWDFYVPVGFAGYYNFQHFEAPGNEWAFEVYFDNNGTGYMHAGGNNAATFTYTNGAWLSVMNVIDLDADWAQVYFDDVLIHEWQYSLQAQGAAGTNQLGGINFYAGATAGMTAKYYFDNIAYLALVEGSQDPAIGINSSSIITTIDQGNTSTQNLPITNIGEGVLTYDIAQSFDMPTAASQPSNLVPSGTIGKYTGEIAVDPTPNITAPLADLRDVTLNYDGDNSTGVGLTNATMWRAAVRFPSSMVRPYNGMYLSQVMIYINDPANAHKVQVYDMGSINVPGPGVLLHEQAFNPIIGWNTITLTTPVYVTGRELWVGYWMDQPAAIFPAGVDAGPAVADGRWISTGPGWGFLSLDYNWNIRALLTGTARPVWLTVTPTTGSLEAGISQDHEVSINANGLAALTIYKAKLHVRSNDYTNERVNISVWITVLVGLNEQGEQTYVSLYPNPATTTLNLKGNTTINKVTISNNLGQVVYFGDVNLSETSIDISNLQAGMYFVRMETANGTATQKLMID